MTNASSLEISWDRIITIIISFFSNFILSVIENYGSRIEILASTIILFIIWMIIDNFAKRFLIRVNTIKENVQWKSVILHLFEFINTLLLFIFARLFFQILNNSIKFSNLNLGEAIIIIIVILLVILTAFIRTKILIYKRIAINNLYDKESVENDTNLLLVWDRAMTIIISYFSSFILEFVEPYSNRLETLLSILVIFIIWILIDKFGKKHILRLNTIKENEQWKQIIVALFEFVSTLLLFLLAQLFFANLIVLVKISNLNLSEIVITLIVLLMTPLTVFHRIRYVIYFVDQNSNPRDMDDSNLLQAWDRATIVIISYFSTFTLDVLQNQGTRIEIVISVLLLYIIWLIFDHFFKSYIVLLGTLNQNPQWKSMISNFFEFITTLFLFIIVQLLFRALTQYINISFLNFFEIIVIIVLLMLVLLTFFQRFKFLFHQQ